MEKGNSFSINYLSLPTGRHVFVYDLTRSFFEGFDYGEIKNGSIKATVLLEKKTKMALADFLLEGTVVTECDRCLDEINLPVKGQFRLVIKESENSEPGDSENEDVIVLATGEHDLNLAPHLYEFVHLLLPMRRKCGSTDKKECNAEVIAKLDQISVKQNREEITDPRWDVLKELKNNGKQLK